MLTKSWILLLLAEFSLAVRIYLHPLSETQTLPSVLSPTQARAAVSHQLGLDTYETVEDLQTVHGLVYGADVFASGQRNAMIMSLSEDVARDVIPDNLRPHSLRNTRFTASDVSLTLGSFSNRATHVYDYVRTLSLSSSPKSVPRLLDSFYLNPTSSSEAFLSELSQLVEMIETDETDVFGAFELTSLSKIAAEHGKDSEIYRLATESTRALFSSAMAKQGLSFVVITYTGGVSTKRQNAIAQPPQSPFPRPTPSPQQPIGSISICHESDSACSNATDSCSGHGECMQASKAGRTCFVCACEATTDENGRVQKWVGDACERKDISAPFALLTGTVVGIIILIAGSIKLLSGIGGQLLPPTLTATAGTGHLKHD